MNDTDQLSTFAPAGTSRAARKKYWIALLVLAAAALVLFLTIRHFQHKAQTAADGSARGPGGQNGPVPVSVATAAYGDIELRIPALGNGHAARHRDGENANQRNTCKRSPLPKGSWCTRETCLRR